MIVLRTSYSLALPLFQNIMFLRLIDFCYILCSRPERLQLIGGIYFFLSCCCFVQVSIVSKKKLKEKCNFFFRLLISWKCISTLSTAVDDSHFSFIKSLDSQHISFQSALYIAETRAINENSISSSINQESEMQTLCLRIDFLFTSSLKWTCFDDGNKETNWIVFFSRLQRKESHVPFDKNSSRSKMKSVARLLQYLNQNF